MDNGKKAIMFEYIFSRSFFALYNIFFATQKADIKLLSLAYFEGLTHVIRPSFTTRR